ncbi:hypothetical protein F4604DRAFT_1689829, partial [Suillus subluteus]
KCYLVDGSGSRSSHPQTSPRNSFAGPVVDKPVDGLVTDLTSPRNSFSARRLLRQAAMLTNRLMVWSLTNISTEFILCKTFAMAGGCVDKPIDDRSLTNRLLRQADVLTNRLMDRSLTNISMEFILCKRRATADGHLSLFRLSATFSARVSVNAWDDKGRVDYYATHIALQSSRFKRYLKVGMIIWSASRISQTPNFRQNDNIINFKIVTLHLNDAFCFDSCAPTTSSLSPTTPTKPPSPPPIPDPRSPQPTHERLLLSSGSFVPGARNRLSMDKQRAERRT